MREKKESARQECDPKTAASLAASSLAVYFKEKGWKLVSFFPNTLCRREKKARPSGRSK